MQESIELSDYLSEHEIGQMQRFIEAEVRMWDIYSNSLLIGVEGVDQNYKKASIFWGSIQSALLIMATRVEDKPSLETLRFCLVNLVNAVFDRVKNDNSEIPGDQSDSEKQQEDQELFHVLRNKDDQDH